jgi:7-keto-8-aminopelargonate synthetase-like enzyme
VDDARMVLTGTLSKALGCYGGFVAARAERIERVRARSSAYLGTTPIPPALASAGREALRVLGEGEVLLTLRRNVALLRTALDGLGLVFGELPVPVLALEPPSAAAGRALHQALRAEGFLVPLVRYPGGPAGAEDGGWLRLAVHAAHAPADLERVAAVLRRHLPLA